jgi:hypothetical protein
LFSDHKEAIDTVIVGLQTEIKTLKAEKEKLKTLWLESQKLLVEEQSKYSSLLRENDLLQVRFHWLPICSFSVIDKTRNS